MACGVEQPAAGVRGREGVWQSPWLCASLPGGEAIGDFYVWMLFSCVLFQTAVNFHISFRVYSVVVVNFERI